MRVHDGIRVGSVIAISIGVVPLWFGDCGFIGVHGLRLYRHGLIRVHMPDSLRVSDNANTAEEKRCQQRGCPNDPSITHYQRRSNLQCSPINANEATVH